MARACTPSLGFVLSLVLLLLSASGCESKECEQSADCSAGDDDSAVDDDDLGDDDSSSDDDDTTPDPENPFPGDSIHQGTYTGELILTYTGVDSGVQFCAGTSEFTITGSGTLSGEGTCVVSLDGQPLEPEATVSISALAEMTDVGNMNDGWLYQTMSYAPGQELKFYLDGSASQGMLDLQWQGLMTTPDDERTFAGHATGELVSSR